MPLSSQSEFLLEIAIVPPERAVAAERAGADRLELCERLDLGGLTPSLDLVRSVRSWVRMPIHVILRPRAGNFVYNADEFAQMEKDIAALRSENIQGIVTGVLLPDNCVDIARMRALVTLAKPLEVTFHRAFDETPNLTTALEDVVLTGARRILTSGGAPTAPEGAPVLRKLIEQSSERVTVLPGGGIHANNIAELVRATSAREIHTGLGNVLPYNSADTAAFESAIRACFRSLQQL